jgi:hypothetical protein
LSHLWQRFLLASALLIGLAIGVGATVFGYDNRTAVDVNWTIFHFHGIPLWTVGVVPVALVLVAGTLFHWMNGLHHFTEHMRHRRRVHELEAELVTLRAHLDQVLEMPAIAANKARGRRESPASLPSANGGLDDAMANEPEPAAAETDSVVETPPASVGTSKRSRKRVKLAFGDATPAESEVTPEPEA